MIYQLVFILLAACTKSKKLCHFFDDKKDALDGVYEAIRVNQKLTADRESGKSPAITDRKFSPQFKEMCPNAENDRVYYDRPDYEPILGEGGFGMVWDAVIAGTHKAVKQIDLSSIIISKLSEKFPVDIDKNLQCIKSIESVLRDESLFIEEKPTSRLDEQGNEISIYVSDIETLNPINLDKLNTPECQLVFDSFKTIKRVVENYLAAMRNEIVLMQELHKYSTANEKPYRTFAKFDYCIVDPDLTVYLVSEKLGPSLRDVFKACNGVINEHDLERRLLTYIGMMYPVVLMHNGGFAHCDIKLNNIVYNSEDLARTYLIDYGLISDEGEECRGRTVGYAPPEAFVADIDFGNIDTEWDTPQFQKHDAFSIGFSILKMELGPTRSHELRSAVIKFEELKNVKEVEDTDETFQKNLDVAIENLLVERYGANYKESKERKVIIDQEFQFLLTQSLSLFYNTRIPVKVLLFLAYKLYLMLINKKMEIKKIFEFFENFSDIKDQINKEDWLDSVAETLGVKEQKKLI